MLMGFAHWELLHMALLFAGTVSKKSSPSIFIAWCRPP